MKYDVLVIGAGPGGYVSAIRCAQLGLKVGIVEKQHLGGVCLNWGCIPTKALLTSAQVYQTVKDACKFGVNAGVPEANLPQIVARSRQVSGKLVGGIEYLLKKNKIDVITGSAKLKDKHTITVDERVYTAKNIILATGARARQIANFESDGRLILTYKEALMQEIIPQTLVVVGSGAIGIEFASFFSTLGTKVTVIEAQASILPVEDEEISELARKALIEQGLDIYTNAILQKIVKLENRVEVCFSISGSDKVILSDKVIMAVGVIPNTENLGLENIGIKLDERGLVLVDNDMVSSIPSIYAIGDIVQGPWLAHKASHEGIIAAEAIAGLKPRKMNKRAIPACTYCNPEVASVGLTQSKAESMGYKVKVGKFPYSANGKALATGHSFGMIKAIFDAKTGELLGAHIVGEKATELINTYVTAITLEATEEDLMHAIFAHPTLSEMIHETALAAWERQIHM